MRRTPLIALLLATGLLTSAAASAGSVEAQKLTRIAIGYTPASITSVRTVETALGATVLESLPDIDADIVGATSGRAATVIAAIGSLPGVRYAQLDGRAYASVEPNDEFWDQEWSPVTTRAPQAWDLTTGAPSVVVAVVDTGVDATQPDLVGRLLDGHDFVNGDEDVADDNGHGTAVAGVVAAAGNNEIGVAGYCWQCRILPVKVLGSDGSGFNSWVAAGILWAVDHGANVINTSLGSVTDDLTVAAAAQYAAGHGVLIVAAAGNAGSSTLQYPAGLPGVLSVSASDQSDHLYSFSNTGAAVAAPGENVTTGVGGSYVTFLGTSSAAPVVSGIAALALSAAPTATAAQVTQAIESTAVPTPGVINGRVDAYAAVHAIAPSLISAPSTSTPASPPAASTEASPSSRAIRAKLEVRGRLTNRQRRRAYTLRTAVGLLQATVAVRPRVALTVRLIAPNGAIVAHRTGVGPLRFKTAVDPMRYRLVVSRRGSGPPISFRATVVFPDPSTLDSSRR